MRHKARESKKKKPLKLLTKQNKLHSKISKSTYFYTNDGDFSKESCHDIFVNRFWVRLSSLRENSRFPEAPSAIPTRRSLSNTNLYGKNAHGRLGLFRSYLLPVVCSMALLLVFGWMVNPFAQGGGEKAYAAYEPVTNTTGVSLLMETSDPLEQQTQASAGVTAYRYNRFKVNKGTDIDKYQILVQAANGYDSTLVGAKNGQTVNAVASATKGSAIDSAWGYSLAEGAITGADSLANLEYQALPGSGSTNTNATLYTETKEFTLAFAANIKDKPADHYQTSVLLSVAAGAGEVVSGFDRVSTMQEMTGGICNQANINDSKQLIDERDGKTYWVTKLKDNNCWMTQNLDLDLNIYNTLTPDDTDVPANWTPTTNTQTAAKPSGFSGTNVVASWDPAQGGVATYCPSGKCNTTSTTSSNNGHDAQGNYYSWAAATAGQAASISAAGESTQSICPKGWRLPLSGGSNNTVSGSFYNLLNGLTVAQITTSPYYFVYGGRVNSSTLEDAGSYGYYWSSTASSGTGAYYLAFYTSVNPSSLSGYRYYGFSVRCVAR